MFDWIKNNLIIVLLVALAAAMGLAGVQTIRLSHAETRFAEYQTYVAKVNRERVEAFAVDLIAARVVETKLRDQIDDSKRKKDEELAAINGRLRVALDGLRNRPTERSAATGFTTSPAGNPEGATGAQLSGPDGNFLAGEAARADTLRAALTSCYRDYDAARDGLKLYGDGLNK